MKKKTVKKLELSKETVLNLTGRSLALAAGGTYVSCNTFCDTCNSLSCGWTCGCESNYVICIEPPATRNC